MVPGRWSYLELLLDNVNIIFRFIFKLLNQTFSILGPKLSRIGARGLAHHQEAEAKSDPEYYNLTFRAQTGEVPDGSAAPIIECHLQ